MARTRAEKEEIVQDLTAKFERSEAAILTDFRGMNVSEITDLRTRMRESGAGYHVVKNSLTQIALEEVGLPIPEALQEGPTAVGFCYDDVAASVKALTESNKEAGLPAIKGGLLGNQLLSIEQISQLANLPSKEVLLGQVVAGVQAPIRGLVNVLSGPTRGLLYALQARKRQLEEEA